MMPEFVLYVVKKENLFGQSSKGMMPEFEGYDARDFIEFCI